MGHGSDKNAVSAEERQKVESLPCFSDIQAISLLSGLTNKSYKVTDGAGTYVVRFAENNPTLGIDRDMEKLCIETALRAGAAPGIVYSVPGVMVSVFIEGEVLTPRRAARPEMLSAVAATLKKAHKPLGAAAAHLQPVDPYTSILQHFKTIREQNIQADRDLDRLQREAHELTASLPACKEPVLCHADLVPANIVHDGKKAWFLDWEYAGAGDPLFDLGWFSVASGFSKKANEQLLQSYYGHVSDETLDNFNKMRALCSLRDALWGVVQSHHSQLDADYQAHAEKYFKIYEDILKSAENPVSKENMHPKPKAVNRAPVIRKG